MTWPLSGARSSILSYADLAASLPAGGPGTIHLYARYLILHTHLHDEIKQTVGFSPKRCQPISFALARLGELCHKYVSAFADPFGY